MPHDTDAEAPPPPPPPPPIETSFDLWDPFGQPGELRAAADAWEAAAAHLDQLRAELGNAVNHGGTVYFVDAQPTGGAVDAWPPKPSSPGYGFDGADVEATYATFFDAGGER